MRPRISICSRVSLSVGLSVRQSHFFTMSRLWEKTVGIFFFIQSAYRHIRVSYPVVFPRLPQKNLRDFIKNKTIPTVFSHNRLIEKQVLRGYNDASKCIICLFYWLIDWLIDWIQWCLSLILLFYYFACFRWRRRWPWRWWWWLTMLEEWMAIKSRLWFTFLSTTSLSLPTFVRWRWHYWSINYFWWCTTFISFCLARCSGRTDGDDNDDEDDDDWNDCDDNVDNDFHSFILCFAFLFRWRWPGGVPWIYYVGSRQWKTGLDRGQRKTWFFWAFLALFWCDLQV